MTLAKLHRQLLSALLPLKQQKLRSALSVLGVVCGVTAVFAMGCIGEGAKKEAIAQIEQLGTRNIILRSKEFFEEQREEGVARYARGLTTDDARRIQDLLPGLEVLSTRTRVNARVFGVPDAASLQVQAISAGYELTQPVKVRIGRFLLEEDSAQQNLVAVLGADLAKRLGSQVGESIRIGNVSFKIIGILWPPALSARRESTITHMDFSEVVLIPMGTQIGLDGGNGSQVRTPFLHLSEIIVKMHRTESVNTSARVLRRIIDQSRAGVEDYTMLVPTALLEKARKAQRTFNIVLGSIAGLSLLVGGIGIMNIMLANVSERKKEIGVRRALGASQRNILIQFLGEGVVLTLIGGVIGLLTGLTCVWGIALFTDWKVAVAPWPVILSLTMAILVGTISGLYPAIIATRIDPMEALRSE